MSDCPTIHALPNGFTLEFHPSYEGYDVIIGINLGEDLIGHDLGTINAKGIDLTITGLERILAGEDWATRIYLLDTVDARLHLAGDRYDNITTYSPHGEGYACIHITRDDVEKLLWTYKSLKRELEEEAS